VEDIRSAALLWQDSHGLLFGLELQQPRRVHLAAPSVKRPSIDIDIANFNFVEHQLNMGMSVTNCESYKRTRRLNTSQIDTPVGTAPPLTAVIIGSCPLR
jgi:hypothetical protein